MGTIHRQRIPLPNTLSFTYIVHNFRRSVAERLKSRRYCGPYVCNRTAPGDRIFFYADSDEKMGDGAVRLRIRRADFVDRAGIDHGGWYTDEHGHRATIAGVVAALPHGRGWLAGWSMGAGMCGELDRFMYLDERECARDADDMAREVAEQECRRSQASDLKQDIEAAQEVISDARAAFTTLAAELRQHCASLPPLALASVKSDLHSLRYSVSCAIREIRDAREKIKSLDY